ncbi:MAG TPA: sigma-70 family RNA polymerase sigma factor [Bacteroidales bacterium]|nr:sigma-70 family RNA polymerase sigma factor [Bacteroidales bacterium]HOU02663.1 sigma-70 family RNA polymerase sigma factor [Bacteroidales bacterium]HQG62942.1 sigma-70 family RNA polymerase sigma factor [Bacteroidales bacterium]HQK67461.1 sigma-70 family RNA polymerase sigma factor [Bacteroidales bacterium]
MRYLPMIRLMVTRSGGSSEDAKDIFQESLIIILEKIDSGEFTLTCKFMTFLYCVCDNLWKATKAKRQSAANYLRSIADSESNDDSDFTENFDDEVYKEIFAEVFRSLDPMSRKVLKMHWKQKTHREIAEELGYTYGYVRKKKYNAQVEMAEKVKRILKEQIS